jgi:predicted RecB family nuclease
METGVNITAAMFAAYLKCRTKAYLTAHREELPDPVFTEMRKRISAAYKGIAGQRAYTGPTVPIDFSRLADGVMDDAGTVFVDCETASYTTEGAVPAWVDHRAKRAGSDRANVPIFYSAWEKSDQSDDLLVCFGALGIAQATGTEIPPKGKVVYGEGHRTKTVRIPDHLAKTRQTVEEIGSTCFSSEPPPLVLNEHCPTCDFQSRCRALAVERDDLSLLGTMTAKERIKCQEKGISTVTHLSYGYRPRRRKRRKTIPAKDDKPSKSDHKLKALAIKKTRFTSLVHRRFPSRGLRSSWMSRAWQIAASITSSVFDTRRKVRRLNNLSGRTDPKMNGTCGEIVFARSSKSTTHKSFTTGRTKGDFSSV